MVRGARRRLHIRRTLRLLERMYGRRTWARQGSGLDVLIEAVLAQNTNMVNATRGYRQLRRRFSSWTKVMHADVEDVRRQIAVCGLSRMRARRLQAMLRRIKELRRRLDLEFLAGESPEDARRFLLDFHGIGPRTASFVLLFAFDAPVLPVDNGVLRVLRRLRLVPPKTPAARAETAIAPLIPAGRHYAMHTLLFAHAKQRCRPKNPACDTCRLLVMCPHGQRHVRHQPPGRQRSTDARYRRPPPIRRLATFISDGLPTTEGRTQD